MISQRLYCSRLLSNPNVANVRGHFTKPKDFYVRSHPERLKEKGWDMVRNISQPYRAVLVFFVGKAHCAEAVESLKEMAYCLTNLLSRQCKVHTSQKFNQMLQLYSFYSRMWGEEMTRRMISSIRRSLMFRGKLFVISAMCIAPFDWNKNLISDESLESCIAEYETVDALCRSTVYCEECEKRQIVDKKIPGANYCMCQGSAGFVDRSRRYDHWEPFLERENILVWRRKHRRNTHLYSYKVYGKYDDMSLSSFMEVQLNASFRTQWDSSALELKVISSHPESNSDLLYWLVKFPHFFANRDYVFKRRYRVNEEKKEVIILNEIAEHPQLKEEKGVHRVKEYWSTMVLRANKDFNEPGMSYTLTYFDNPGTSLPTPVTNFVASTAFPDFLRKVYVAAMSLQRRWEDGEDVYVTIPSMLRHGFRRGDVAPLTDVEIDTDASSVEGDSSVKEMAKLTQLRVIKEAIMDADDNADEVSKGNYRIPLKFRKAVIDLLEAIEVISPEYQEKTFLTNKIESLVDKLDLDKARKNNLVKRLESIRNRTKSFMSDAAKKRKESIKIMNEFEKRKHYYDQSFADEKSVILFKTLLIAINEVLKADRDMRTGKSFGKTETDSSPAEPLSDRVDNGRKSNESGTTESQNETAISENDVEKCEAKEHQCHCCQNQSPASSDDGNVSSWWWYSEYVYFWRPKNTEEKYSKTVYKTCTCNHAPKSKSESSNNKISSHQQTLISESLNRSWYNQFLGLFVSQAASLDTQTPIKKDPSKEVESKLEHNSPTCSIEKGEESSTWYFFSWVYRLWSGASA